MPRWLFIAPHPSNPPARLTARHCRNKKNKRWQAAINAGGKYLYLGSYDTEEEAAQIFDKAAIRIRGQKARLNFRCCACCGRGCEGGWGAGAEGHRRQAAAGACRACRNGVQGRR